MKSLATAVVHDRLAKQALNRLSMLCARESSSDREHSELAVRDINQILTTPYSSLTGSQWPCASFMPERDCCCGLYTAPSRFARLMCTLVQAPDRP